MKNEIFRPLANDPATATQLYRERWEPFEKSFRDQRRLDEYYYPFTLTVNDRATVSSAFRVLSEHWKSEFGDIDDPAVAAGRIIDHLSTLVPEYNALSGGEVYSATPEISDRVERLARMKAPRVMYAFLMQLLHAQRCCGLSSAAAVDCMNIVESFLVRRAFSGREPTGLHAVFKSLWEKNQGKPATLVSDLQTRTIDFPCDDQLRNDILTKPFYDRRLDGYVLSELEIASHRTNPLSRQQLDAITVDHLAPQSLKGDWAKQFPEDAEERKHMLDMLGNLVPLSQADNSTKGAADWDEARSRLRNETIYRTARAVLDNHHEWGPKQILERTADLAESAILRWPKPD